MNTWDVWDLSRWGRVNIGEGGGDERARAGETRERARGGVGRAWSRLDNACV